MMFPLVSCGGKGPPPKEPDPAGDFFDDLQESLDNAAAESVTVIAVDDSVDAGENLQRQVYQEIQSRLYELETVGILEYPKSQIESQFEQMGIVPSDGISPDDAISLAQEFKADALLYASIESKAPDVHFKVYAAETGAVIFSDTLEEWQLPISAAEEEVFDLFDLEDTSDATETDEESVPDETAPEED